MDLITIGPFAVAALTGVLGYMAGKAGSAVVQQERDDALGRITALNAENQLVTGRLIAAREVNEGYSRKLASLRMIIAGQRGKISAVSSERDAVQAKYALATKCDALGRFVGGASA